jgi:DNA-binding phage protein
MNATLQSLYQSVKAQGLSQAQWAQRAGVRAETVSRLKRSGNADLATLTALAAAVGMQLIAVPANDFAVQAVRGTVFE